ncbi:MAG: Nif3-like dinuclear metal center hexameric protein, partial [Deltaproteobacteria bacterium]|nr:Nif3-like dinuclear metal center hexameric protein [Deltaproteobacteria bacterium]
MGVTLLEVTKALEAFAPLGLAEPWDRPGLQAGDPEARVEAVVVALDPSAAAVARAAERGAQLVVTHHPLLLSPLSRLDCSEPVGKLLADCLRRGIALYAAHTNLDRADGGVNDALAGKLGLREVRPLCEGEDQVKLVVTVP